MDTPIVLLIAQVALLILIRTFGNDPKAALGEESLFHSSTIVQVITPIASLAYIVLAIWLLILDWKLFFASIVLIFFILYIIALIAKKSRTSAKTDRP